MTASSLPGGMDIARFLHVYWQKKPCLMRAAVPGFKSPLRAEELAGLACEEDVESRLVEQTDEPPGWRMTQGPFTEERFLHLPEKYWTLLVQDVDKHVPQLAGLLSQFDFIPSWRIDDVMVSYAADGGSVGPHIDAYDVFLLQAQGKRRWQISSDTEAMRELPDSDLRTLENFEAAEEWLLEPGDMLYLPPGVAHFGIAEGACMTYSIGMRAPDTGEMLPDLLEFLLQQRPVLRYSDPDLQPAGEPGRISSEALAGMRRLVRTALQIDDSELNIWFGRYITEPKPWLCDSPAQTPLKTDDLAEALAASGGFERSPLALFAWFPGSGGEDELFINGKHYHLPAPLTGLAALLANNRSLPYAALRAYMVQTEAREFLMQLYNQGHLVLADHEHKQV